jgi:hypothetical protein
MAYLKTTWATGDIITATKLNNAETQYDEAKADLDAHEAAADPHPQYALDTDAPNAHKASHATGGSDALTPSDIGAETPTGAQSKADTAETNAKNFAKSYGVGSTAYLWSNNDLNTALAGGWYRGSGMTNAPSADWYYVEVIQHASTWVVQIATRLHTNSMYMRRLENGIWQPWVKIWNASNDGAGSGLDADTVDGKHASEFMNGAKAYGNATYTDTINFGTTLEKRIPLGAVYKYGQMAIKRNASSVTNGMLVVFSQDNLKTKAVGHTVNAGSYVSAWARRWLGIVTRGDNDSAPQYGSGTVGDNRLRIDELYIDGSDLVILFRNTHTSTNLSLDALIDWEVW